MEKELKNQTEVVLASSGGLLAVELFLQNNYLFRRNVLSGKTEFATLPTNGWSSENRQACLDGRVVTDENKAKGEPEYRELTPEAEMSIIIQARKELADEKCNPKTDIQDLLRSEEVRAYDPIREFLEGLPQ